MQKFWILVMLLAIATVLIGCGKPGYVGTWKAEGGMFSISMVIDQDGTGTSSGSSDSMPITWKSEGDHILITEPQSGQSVPARLSSDGSGLTMGDGNNSQVYIRQ